jgi:NADH:ubiquinone oxidoreductase subunit 3 (subunit A)
MTRVVEGSVHVVLVSFFVVLEMFFLLKIILFLKTRKRTMERNELYEDGGCRG